jgi:glycosyltransferase involved in cell wall biosynthesis
MVELSVVVPVYNGEACLEELARQVAAMACGKEFEMIFVDDQSIDAVGRSSNGYVRITAT